MTPAQEIAKFCDEYEQLRGLDPELIYGLHRGDERGCALTVSTLRLLVAENAKMRVRLGIEERELLDEEECGWDNGRA